MAGSKGGKHSKGKGKSKSNKSKTNQKKPESFDSKLDHAQIPSTTDTSPLLVSADDKVPSELDITSSSKKFRVLERINSRPALVFQLRQNVPILVATIREKIGASIIEQQDLEDGSGGITEGSDVLGTDFLTFLDEENLNITRWLESQPNDPKTAVIADLMINIKNLQERVNVRKEWAQQKFRDSAKRLSKDLLELRILRMEKVEAQYWKDEDLCIEQSCKLTLREADLSLRSVNSDARFIDETIRTMEITNAQVRADTEALKLGASEYESNLNDVLTKERRCKKRISNIEKQTKNFRAECDKEMQRVLQLRLEDSQAEKEIEESERKWRQEIQEKEHTLALLAEEARKAEMRKTSSKALLAKLSQELNTKSGLKKDEHQRLENELSRLRLSPQSSLEGDHFSYNGVQVTQSNIFYESSLVHRRCIFCLDNDVCVVLLPCTHQVLCVRCYEEICNTVDGCCPYCHAKIQQGIKVFG